MSKAFLKASILILGFLTIALTQGAYAHSGRTNAAGCHTNSKTGDYHCHNASAPKPPAAAPKIQDNSAAIGALKDQQIRQLLIQQSIAAYSGNCACPFNSASNGSRCGRRSAYSRPGGASPLCYDSDITAKMIADYRSRKRN